MKIEIEINSSTEAKVIIDGRELKVVRQPGQSHLEGVNFLKEESLGSLTAHEVHDLTVKVMQARSAANGGSVHYETWDQLPEDVFNETEDAISF